MNEKENDENFKRLEDNLKSLRNVIEEYKQDTSKSRQKNNDLAMIETLTIQVLELQYDLMEQNVNRSKDYANITNNMLQIMELFGTFTNGFGRIMNLVTAGMKVVLEKSNASTTDIDSIKNALADITPITNGIKQKLNQVKESTEQAQEDSEERMRRGDGIYG